MPSWVADRPAGRADRGAHRGGIAGVAGRDLGGSIVRRASDDGGRVGGGAHRGTAGHRDGRIWRALNNLVGAESAFNTNLLANEIGWETATFGGHSAFNGALNRAFNIGNLVLSTGEQTVNSFLGGIQAPALFLTGSGAQVFNGGNIGGIEGIFDQSLALGADLAGLL